MLLFFFFFNDTATTEIYTLSLHDALPICLEQDIAAVWEEVLFIKNPGVNDNFFDLGGDRKSTRLNSSHSQISYAVFCLKKKNKRTRVSGHANARFRHSLCRV